MKISQLFASPLAGTATVMAGLAVLAVPLHRLTSAPPVVATPAVEIKDGCVSTTHAVLRLKLLAPARKATLGLPGGIPLLDLTNIQTGVSEHDVDLVLDHGVCELELAVDFGDAAMETAVFLTTMPDDLEEKTLFITGTGRARDILRFEWPHHHD
ncbi:MAG: hypothetical protein WCS43_01105 [Verrucomicrobiota bacterium]